MNFKNDLKSGILRCRYKRFLADIELDDGSILTVHCPNTGAMTGCAIPGATAFFSDSGNPKRKYRHTLEWIQVSDQHRACINTGLPNVLVKEAIENEVIEELNGYQRIKIEVPYGQHNSRVDLLLKEHESGAPDCYVEVKNATLVEGDIGYFPDAVSIRAQRHIQELVLMVKQGYRAVLVFCANHTAMKELRPADKVDIDYGQILREAARQGVELLAYRTEFDANTIQIVESIPVVLDR